MSGLAIDLAEEPALPSRVEIRHAAPALTRIWFINGSTGKVAWSTQGLAAETNWRVYLSGDDTIQEIGRSPWTSGRGTVSHSTGGDGWTEWTFERSDPNDAFEWDITAGDYSLIAVADKGPAIYLGKILAADPLPWFFSTTVADEPSSPPTRTLDSPSPVTNPSTDDLLIPLDEAFADDQPVADEQTPRSNRDATDEPAVARLSAPRFDRPSSVGSASSRCPTGSPRRC